MSKGTDTKQKMITSALDLFHQQGVNATSIDQILELSGTGKSQFSYYFKTKDGLVNEVLLFLTTAIRNNLTPTDYEINSWTDFENWFRKYIDYQKSVKFERSCPIGTIANDLSSSQHSLRQEVRIFLEWSHGKMSRFFAEKKAKGELPPKTNPDTLADFCISIMQGGMLLTKMKRDSDMFENAAKEAINYVKMLRKMTGPKTGHR